MLWVTFFGVASSELLLGAEISKEGVRWNVAVRPFLSSCMAAVGGWAGPLVFTF